MTRERRTAGIKEVAHRAGVSVGTVSYVLNNPRRVAEATRARVIASMEELGFVRNDLARQLRTGAATTVGMLVLDIANPFFAALAHACEMAAEALGLTVVLGSSDQDLGREDRYLELFEEQRVHGILVAAVDGATPRMQELARRGVPVVLFDPYAGSDGFCSVALDGAIAGRLGLSHLVEAGRTDIALAGGPYHQVRDRWDAARAEAEGRGVRVRHIDSAGQTFDEGRRVGDEIASLDPTDRPDAIFAANDLLALGIMQSLLATEVDIPTEIAVLGIDGIEYAGAAPVGLSTLAQPITSIATAALELLVDHAKNGQTHEHRHMLVAPELIVRASTGG